MALYARWHRIEQVIGLLEGFVNAGQLLLDPAVREWKYGEPVGISFKTTDSKEEDCGLALAYAFLEIPISLPEGWTHSQGYALQDAQMALLSNN